MQMDKIDAQIICRICSMYNVYFEFLLDIELEEIQAIKRAWDDEKQSVLTGAKKGTVKQVDMKYYVQIVGLLERIKRDNFGLYRRCTAEMNDILKKDKAYCKKAGLIVKDDENYSNVEYYANYVVSEEALNKAKAILGSYRKN